MQLFFILALSMTGSTEAIPDPKTPDLAVMPLDAKRMPTETVEILDELLINAVHRQSHFQAIGISDINAMLGLEQVKDALGCNDVACAVELGGALGVRYLLAGSISKLGSHVYISLKLIDTHKARVHGRTQVKIEDDKDLFEDAITSVVEKLLGNNSSKNPASTSTTPEESPLPEATSETLSENSSELNSSKKEMPQPASSTKSTEDSEFEITMELKTGYATNPGRLPETYQNMASTNNKAPNDLVLLIHPEFSYRNSSRNHPLKLNADLEYRHYTGLFNKLAGELSTQVGEVAIEGTLNKYGNINLSARGSYKRSDDPEISSESRRLMYNASQLNLKSFFRLDPDISLAAKYDLTMTFYDLFDSGNTEEDWPLVPDNSKERNYIRNRAELNSFFHLSSALMVFLAAGGETTHFPDYNDIRSSILRIFIGASHSLTSNIRVRLKAGYGDTLEDEADRYQALLGLAEISYINGNGTIFKLGYKQDIVPRTYYKFAKIGQSYLNLETSITNSLSFKSQITHAILNYGDTTDSTWIQANGRKDTDTALKIEVRYDLTPSFTISLFENLLMRDSNATFIAGSESYFSNLTGMGLSYSY